jgi:hypothetical protein
VVRFGEAENYVNEKRKNQTLAKRILENWSMILLIRSGSNGRPILIQFTYNQKSLCAEGLQAVYG